MNAVFQAKHVEEYTAKVGSNFITTSNTTIGNGKRLKFACFSVDADGTIDFVTLGGDTVTGFAVRGGIVYPDQVVKITALGTATKVWIHHNGERYAAQ